MLKRSRHSAAGTPLTRQVMTKSIHRAILEYQHSQNGVITTPKSPLDLRVKSVNRDTTENIHCEDVRGAEKSIVSSEKYSITPLGIIKSHNIRRFDDDDDDDHDDDECFAKHEIKLPNITKIEPSQTSGSKLWSFISTFFRFASLTPPNVSSMPLSKENGTEPHMIIKRCASFTGKFDFKYYHFKIFYLFINISMICRHCARAKSIIFT